MRAVRALGLVMIAPDRAATVLVVEDEVLLLLYAEQFLADAGFMTVTAPNADAALRLLETRGDIDIVLTDINMPGSMNGIDLIHVIRDRWSTLPVAVISGNARHPHLPDDVPVFSKPVDGRRVAAKLRTMMKR